MFFQPKASHKIHLFAISIQWISDYSNSLALRKGSSKNHKNAIFTTSFHSRTKKWKRERREGKRTHHVDVEERIGEHWGGPYRSSTAAALRHDTAESDRYHSRLTHQDRPNPNPPNPRRRLSSSRPLLLSLCLSLPSSPSHDSNSNAEPKRSRLDHLLAPLLLFNGTTDKSTIKRLGGPSSFPSTRLRYRPITSS